MFTNLFKRFKKVEQSKSPMVRDTLRRLSGVKDDSATGRAIQSTEVVMAQAMKFIGDERLNENDATRESSIYFLAGTAIGYCYKYGTREPEDIQAVLRCTMRHWIKNPADTDQLVDYITSNLEDNDFAGPLIDSAAEAAFDSSHEPKDVVDVFSHCLKKWRTFDIDAYDKKLESEVKAELKTYESATATLPSQVVELMNKLGITFDDVHYHYKTYKYTNFSDAINYAIRDSKRT